jgi:hypothetical protein
MMKEMKVRWPFTYISILHWPWPLCSLDTFKAFTNWKQSVYMIYYIKQLIYLRMARWTKNCGKRSSDFKLYKLTCDSCCRLLAVSSILSLASWSLSLSMCLLTGEVFKDDKKLLAYSLHIPAWHLIPPPVCPGVRVSLFISLTCNSYLCYETGHSLVSQPLL